MDGGRSLVSTDAIENDGDRGTDPRRQAAGQPSRRPAHRLDGRPDETDGWRVTTVAWCGDKERLSEAHLQIP